MTRPLLPIVFRDLDLGTSACLMVALLACALLCPPLVRVFLLTLLLAVATPARLRLPALLAAHPRRPHARPETLRGPPAA